jgi:hypothetical protein
MPRNPRTVVLGVAVLMALFATVYAAMGDLAKAKDDAALALYIVVGYALGKAQRDRETAHETAHGGSDAQ